MEQKKSSIVVVFRELKPHFLMVLAQVGYASLYFITEASFNHGMSPFLYVTYRHIVAAVVMFPFAYFLERNERPKLTFPLFMEIFVLSLIGYEALDLRDPRGIAKVIGTLVSFAGVMTMTLYKGPAMRNLWHPIIHIQGKKAAAVHENWLKGSLLAVISCVAWSVWYIMQAATLKRYPAQLSLTTWMSFVGAAQSAVFTVIVIGHKPSAWSIGFNIDMWSTLYGVSTDILVLFKSNKIFALKGIYYRL
ncbi:hypothetical protein PIB30_011190 [Stylosanthes scabra]|uniref:WAT1-related protein n=1 Tax=Stylosanthes scabra TaxID=79078 RepID=A0ABU6S5J5_9FABA|nr:hypothetical protein [Stylosanthes scabra]